MDEYLNFENANFCSNNCNFFRFCAYSLSLLLIFFYFSFFNNVLQLSNTHTV